MNRAIDCYDSNITPSDIYSIDILEAMRMADAAWKDVDATTVRNCWLKSGILPDSLLNAPPRVSIPTIPITSLVNPDPRDAAVVAAEGKVTASLSHLETIGVLQKSNRMDLDEVLNPAHENDMFDDGSDEEIYQAVID
ncbi:hypothetical protein C0991_006314 [Blastosporella zonata]|nr:hypothetical protein C0991_006314 [Blastosporella zonata]